MDGFKLFDSITIKNFLSFGPENEPFKMEPLNVLIGPNGSGKSNFIEAFKFLRSIPDKGLSWIFQNGGLSVVNYKNIFKNIEIMSVLNGERYQQLQTNSSEVFPKLAHSLSISVNSESKVILISDKLSAENNDLEFFYDYKDNNNPKMRVNNKVSDGGAVHSFTIPDSYSHNVPVISQFSDPVRYPEMFLLASQYRKLRFFGGANYVPEKTLRLPLRTDHPDEELYDDLSNIGVVYHNLFSGSENKSKIGGLLKRFFPLLDDFHLKLSAGSFQLVFDEIESMIEVPATRVSDGTLRFFALLVILCHPKPPPFICIEEPENGLHPDAISILGELLKDASQRTQIVVTTHSPDLVAEFTDMPEAVVVMDRDENGASTMKRLDENRLKSWLENDYSLGKIWQSGEIGGNLY